jgi:hypothetical protein
VADMAQMPSQSNDLLRGSPDTATRSLTLKDPFTESSWIPAVSGNCFKALCSGPATDSVRYHDWKADVIPEAGQRTCILQLFHRDTANGAIVFGIVVSPSATDPNLWLRIGSIVIQHVEYAPESPPYFGEIQTITLI